MLRDGDALSYDFLIEERIFTAQVAKQVYEQFRFNETTRQLFPSTYKPLRREIESYSSMPNVITCRKLET